MTGVVPCMQTQLDDFISKQRVKLFANQMHVKCNVVFLFHSHFNTLKYGYPESPFSPQKVVVYFTCFGGRYVGSLMAHAKFLSDTDIQFSVHLTTNIIGDFKLLTNLVYGKNVLRCDFISSNLPIIKTTFCTVLLFEIILNSRQGDIEQKEGAIGFPYTLL